MLSPFLIFVPIIFYMNAESKHEASIDHPTLRAEYLGVSGDFHFQKDTIGSRQQLVK